MLEGKSVPPAALDDILSAFQNIWHQDEACKIHLQYIPGHCGIAGNEKADQLAVAGSKQHRTDKTPSSYETAKLIAALHIDQLWKADHNATNSDSSLLYRQIRLAHMSEGCNVGIDPFRINNDD